MYGWCGKIAKIDLSKGKISYEEPDIDILFRYIGGRGVAGHYLREKCDLRWDDPDQPLLFFAGPLVATASPTSGRMTIMSRSPLTGTVGDTSVGGGLGTQIKKTGFDGIIVTGKSRNLCGIEINEGSISIIDAAYMAGWTTDITTAYNAAKGSVATIGPAAENGVVYSSIIVDGQFAAGRNGIGLVFASKNIKYLTVKGSRPVPVYDREELKEAVEDVKRLIASSPALLGNFGISNYGTPALYDLMHVRHMMPTENFRKTWFKNAGMTNAHSLNTRYASKKDGCDGCHIRCKKVDNTGQALPEFETLSHFSALLDNSDISLVVKANRICNAMGMDTVTAASTLACYSEINKVKLKTYEILELLYKIANREGIGRELSHGSYRYACSRGYPELSMSVKGQELPAYDPRGAYGMALAYATSTRGGCHLRAYPVSHEILRKPVATDRFSFSGKARMIKQAEDINAVLDSLSVCKFVFFGASLEEYAKITSAVTGKSTSAHDLMKSGERIYYNERIMNALNGFTGEDDDLPARFFTEPGTGGGNLEIAPLDRREFLEAKARYYKIRGLTLDGMPEEENARKLGLKWKSL